MDAMKLFNNNNFVNQAKSMMQSIDLNNVATIQRRNTETMINANQMIAENTQAIMQRQAEIIQKESQNLFDIQKDASSNNIESNMDKGANFVKNMFDNSIDNTRELIERITKSNMELYDYLTKRLSENISELNNTAQNVTNNVKKKASAA
jgi:phasin family protein